MSKEEVKRWEIVKSRGKVYLRDRYKNEGILIEIHETQIISEDEFFIIVYCRRNDFNFKTYSSFSLYDEYAEIYVYMFKKKGGTQCYTLFQ